MSAVIKAIGVRFDVDAFLVGCTLPVCTSYRRGDRKFGGAPDNPIETYSGVHLVASVADFADFSKQETDATDFLRLHVEQLRRLRWFPGVESVTLDFGIERRNLFVQCNAFSPELVALTAALGFGIRLLIYPGSHEAPPDIQSEAPPNADAPQSSVS